MDEMCWCWFWLCVADPDSGFVPGARSSSAPGIPAHNTLHLKGKAAEHWSLSIPWAVCPECCLMAELPHALCKYSRKCRSWECGFVMGILAPCGTALVQSCRKTSLCHHPDLSQAALVPGAGWKCPAALLPSFGSWDVIRKEKRENGLFLPEPCTSFWEKTDKHEIIAEIKANTQNIWHWVKCFSWASGLCFALLFRLGEISTLWESASQSLLHKRYSETSVMYSCLFKKMGHFHTNVIFLCRKYAEFIPYLLVKAIPLLVLWFQHICLTGDNQKMRRKNYYFLINSCRPNVRLSTWVQHLWATHRNIILQWLFFFFEQGEPQSSESCCFAQSLETWGKKFFWCQC